MIPRKMQPHGSEYPDLLFEVRRDIQDVRDRGIIALVSETRSPKGQHSLDDEDTLFFMESFLSRYLDASGGQAFHALRSVS